MTLSKFMKNKLKIVHVEWSDPAFAKSGWINLGGDFEDWIKTGVNRSDTVGILAYECKEFIVIVQSVGENLVADGIKITRSAIKKISVIGKINLRLKLNFK